MICRLTTIAGLLAVLLLFHSDVDPKAEVNSLIFDDSLVLPPSGGMGFDPAPDN
jgi:hypothetical protein